MVVLNGYTCWLLFLSSYDAFKGLMHTVFYRKAAKAAGFDLSQQADSQIALMAACGTSNFLTSAIFLFIVFQAPEIAPPIIGMMGFSHLFSFAIVNKALNIKSKRMFPSESVTKVISFLCCVIYLGYALHSITHLTK